jgi:hypothetical protein
MYKNLSYLVALILFTSLIFLCSCANNNNEKNTSKVNSILSNSSNNSSSAISDETMLAPLSLNSFKEMEDWIAGKNEFTSRHKSTKKDLIEKKNFFEENFYFKLGEDFKDYRVNEITFYWDGYDVSYESESTNNKIYGTDEIRSYSIGFLCSFSKKPGQTVYSLFADERKDPGAIKNGKYSEIKKNGIDYLVQEIPTEPSEGPRISWMQDDHLITVFFYGRQYTEDLLDNCIAEKVYIK